MFTSCQLALPLCKLLQAALSTLTHQQAAMLLLSTCPWHGIHLPLFEIPTFQSHKNVSTFLLVHPTFLHYSDVSQGTHKHNRSHIKYIFNLQIQGEVIQAVCSFTVWIWICWKFSFLIFYVQVSKVSPDIIPTWKRKFDLTSDTMGCHWVITGLDIIFDKSFIE